MTPDRLDYHPCLTCGVLAPVDRPHPATFCERQRPAQPLGQVIRELTAPTAVLRASRDVAKGELVAVNVEALWGGT
jgi:hypothetical protein